MSALASQMNRRVLVIDDNPAIHEDFRKLLSPAPRLDGALEADAATLFGDAPAKADHTPLFEMFSAHQGQEALRMVEDALANRMPYALAFVDMRMPPGWDGLKTIQQLWRSDPKLQIVICTAYADHTWDEIKATLESNERWLVLKKPFDKIEVIQLAHALTEKWNLTELANTKVEALESLVRARTLDLESSYRARSEFLANASHELLTPMNAVCGMLGLLAETPLDESQKSYVQDADHGAQNLLRLIRRILDFNLAESGSLQPDATDFSPGDLLRKIVREFEIPALAKGLSIQADIAELGEGIWRGPEAFIKKTFELLVDNAIKFTPFGSIYLRAKPAESGLAFTVADTGIGLSEEQLKWIQIPFAQVDGGSTRRSSGIGLGLPLANRIVKSMGGRLEFRSLPGDGVIAEFSVLAQRI
jgi:signal transduction histidine kinase